MLGSWNRLPVLAAVDLLALASSIDNFNLAGSQGARAGLASAPLSCRSRHFDSRLLQRSGKTKLPPKRTKSSPREKPQKKSWLLRGFDGAAGHFKREHPSASNITASEQTAREVTAPNMQAQLTYVER
jgi:hypothetical protein